MDWGRVDQVNLREEKKSGHSSLESEPLFPRPIDVRTKANHKLAIRYA